MVLPQIGPSVGGHFIALGDLKERLARPGFDGSYVFIEPSYAHVLADGKNFKCGNSQHPQDDVMRGEQLIKDVYESIRASQYWDISLLIVTYDEHGGFYDHVIPPPGIVRGDLMRDLGLRGNLKGKATITTMPHPVGQGLS